ncbi:hypothetical protein B484DRAFT_431223, partial [Ochromonadaceae sp. CCMP2298]
MHADTDARSIESVGRTLQLPPDVVRSYRSTGLKELYDWQLQCLFSTGVLEGGHLVYCAPTGGGKTLVAELVLLRTVLLMKKKVIFVLPYVSLVIEKEKSLKKLLAGYNRSQPLKARVAVRGFHGDHAGSRSYKEQVLVTTVEKANGIFNSLVQRGLCAQLGCVLFDEVHILGGAFNGHLLEMLISKIKFVEFLTRNKGAPDRTQGPHSHTLQKSLPTATNLAPPAATALALARIQMVALSATMGNVEQLAQWVGGALYRTSFRPVPLLEHVKAGSELLNAQGRLLGTLPSLGGGGGGGGGGTKSGGNPDPDHTILLCQQSMGRGQQVLVFCPSKYACVQTCSTLTDFVRRGADGGSGSAGASASGPTITHLPLDADSRQQLQEGRRRLLQALEVANPHAEAVLKASLAMGVAYHNAGLSAAERAVVESGFREGLVSVLAATSTLASGVNLPAGRVLIRSLQVGREVLGVVQYRQMSGRAGRAGQGAGVGESFLLVKAAEKQRALALLAAQMPDVQSRLCPQGDAGNKLMKALLEVVALGLCTSAAQLLSFVRHTLLYHQSVGGGSVSGGTGGDVLGAAWSLLGFLLSTQAVESSVDLSKLSPTSLSLALAACAGGGDEKENDCRGVRLEGVRLKATRFGRAIVQSNVDPDDAIVMYESLHRAEAGLNLESHLHLLYLVTPLDHRLYPDFPKLLRAYELSHSRGGANSRTVADVFDAVGVTLAALGRWQHNAPGKAAVDLCSQAVRLHALYGGDAGARTAVERTLRNMSSDDWKMLSRCKRLYAASALQALLEGGGVERLAGEFGVDAAALEGLLQGALGMAARVVRFCEQVGWGTMERMVKALRPALQSAAAALGLGEESAEMQALLQAVPFIPRKIARVLCDRGMGEPGLFMGADPEAVAQLLLLSVDFEVLGLDEIEVNLEAAETSEGVQEGEGQSLSLGPECPSGGTRSGAVASRDEQTKLRLVAIVRTLQSAARDAEGRRLEAEDSRAVEFMAALGHPMAVSARAGAGVGAEAEAVGTGAGAGIAQVEERSQTALGVSSGGAGGGGDVGEEAEWEERPDDDEDSVLSGDENTEG